MQVEDAFAVVDEVSSAVLDAGQRGVELCQPAWSSRTRRMLSKYGVIYLRRERLTKIT
jgi:hypothetical protein